MGRKIIFLGLASLLLAIGLFKTPTVFASTRMSGEEMKSISGAMCDMKCVNDGVCSGWVCQSVGVGNYSTAVVTRQTNYPICHTNSGYTCEYTYGVTCGYYLNYSDSKCENYLGTNSWITQAC